MERKKIVIHFKSFADFKNRFCRIWQDAKDDEVYEFTFSDKETEEAYERLMNIRERKKIVIHFENLEDFKNRYSRIWQDATNDEMYEFTFSDKETEEAYERLMK